MSRDRAQYADVGRALRDSIERALAAPGLTGRDLKVLLAIHHYLASWSRLSDRIYTQALANLTGLAENKVRESVAKLVKAGAILRAPSPGRHASTYGLPSPRAGSIDLPEGRTDPPQSRGVSDGPTHPADGAPTLPADGVTTEKVLREERATTTTARAALGREPGAFTELLDEIPLWGPARADVLRAWLDEPECVESCVDEWWERRIGDGEVGPGLLWKMVVDGDDYRPLKDADVAAYEGPF